LNGRLKPQATSPKPEAASLTPLSSVVRVNGPYADAIRGAIGSAWIAGDFAGAAAASQHTTLPVATMAGDLFRGPHVVTGGTPDEARGILETKRQIRELRERLEEGRDALEQLAEETQQFEITIAQAISGITALTDEHHRREKAIVGFEAQLQRSADETTRLAQKGEQLARERRQAEEERENLNRREEEARASISRLEQDQLLADERLTAAQRRLLEAREAADGLSRRAAEAGASHAGLVERAAALEADVRRLEESGAELEARARTLSEELAQIASRLDALAASVSGGESQLDRDVLALETMRQEVRTADESLANRRAAAD
jgi:chromosome segregation ATPase